MNIDAGSVTLTVGNGSTYSLTAGGPNNNTAGEVSIYSVPLSDLNARVNINSSIVDNGSGKTSVNTYGGMTFSQAGTFSGGTYLNAGYIWANNASCFGSGPVYVYPGGELILNVGSGTFANNFYIIGNGGGKGDPLAVRDNGGNATLSGQITLLGTATFGAAGGTTTINGLITGPGGLYVMTSFADASLHLGESSANTYTGDTTIDAAGFGNDTGHAITIWVNSTSHNNIMPSGSGAGNLIVIGGSSKVAQFDVGGSTQTVNGLISSGTVDNANATSGNGANGALVVGANNATSEFDGRIGKASNNSGTTALTLTKIGSGTFTLGNANNNYVGNTTISNGVLALTGSGAIANTPQIILAGGNFDVSGLSSTFNLASSQSLILKTADTVNGAFAAPTGSTINLGTNALTKTGNLTLSGGTLNYTLDTITNGNNGAVIVTGGLNLSGNSTIQVSYSTLGAGRYKLITYTGSLSGSAAANLTLSGASASGRQTAVLDDSISGEIDLLVSSGAPAAVVWTGADVNHPTRWNNSQTDTNWFAAGAANALHYFDADFVTFNDANNGQYTVNIAATNAPGSLLVTNGAGNYIFTTSNNGKITGATTLVKDGSGTLTLAENGGDNFSGGIAVSNGTVILDNNNSAITGGANIASTGVLQIGNNDANGALPSGTVTDNGSITINRNDSGLTVASAIGGSGTVVNNGSGSVTITGNNSFSGGLIINSGTVLVSSPVAGHTGLGTGATTVNTNTTLVGTNADAFGYNVAPTTININLGTVTDVGTSSYRITLPNLNFTGGTLTSAAGNNGDGNGNYSLNGSGGSCTVTTAATNVTATISAPISIQSPTNFNVAAGTTPSGVDLLIASAILPYGSQPFTKSGLGLMLLDFNSPACTSPITISAGTLQVGAASDTVALTTPLGRGAVTNNATLNSASSQAVTISNNISGTGILTKNGNNILTMSGNSINWTGAVSVISGTLKFGAANALGRGTNTPITVASGATLDFNGIGNHTNAVTVSGSGVGGNGAIINSGADAYPAVAFLTLAGDTAIGGSGRSGFAFRWRHDRRSRRRRFDVCGRTTLQPHKNWRQFHRSGFGDSGHQSGEH